MNCNLLWRSNADTHLKAMHLLDADHDVIADDQTLTHTSGQNQQGSYSKSGAAATPGEYQKRTRRCTRRSAEVSSSYLDTDFLNMRSIFSLIASINCWLLFAVALALSAVIWACWVVEAAERAEPAAASA